MPALFDNFSKYEDEVLKITMQALKNLSAKNIAVNQGRLRMALRRAPRWRGLLLIYQFTAMARKSLLICGILSSLLYAALNVLVPLQWPAYNSAAQTVSELSAVGAPTRTLWLWLCGPYTLLVIAFAWGVWLSADYNRPLRIAAALMLAYGVLGLIWPFAPMHPRSVLAAGGATFSDTLHIMLGAVTEVLYLLALGFAAFAFGKAFRWYSIATFVVLMVFGTMTFMDAPLMGKDLPTPLIGVWERINIGVFLLWVVVLAVRLLRPNQSYLKQTDHDKEIND
jgi:hypothetical protein